MRPEGLEPPTIGSEDRSTEMLNAENTDTYESAKSALTPQLTPDSQKQAQSDTRSLPPDLAEIVVAWPKLPKHIRAAVNALVRSYPAED